MPEKSCLLLVCLVTLGAAPAGAGEVRLDPIVSAFIETISADQRDDYGDLIATLFDDAMIQRNGRDDLARMLAMLAGNHQAIEVQSAKRVGNQITLVGRDAAGQWLSLNLSLSSAQPGRIAGLGVRMIPPPRDPEGKPMDEKTWLAALRGFVEDQVTHDGFSGAVIIARGDTPIYAAAYGLADKASGRPITLDTPINLGSMNKMFTGLAVAQLVERGKLAYGDTVGRYLPDYPDARVRDEVTIHQLLTHTSGLGSYWNDRYDNARAKLDSVTDFATLCIGAPLAFDPGTRFQYSNCGPVVLGLIIEAVSGESYYAYIRKNIYAPAGMRDSGHLAADDPEPAYAVGYLEADADGRREPNTATLGRIGSPAGGGYASARDLLRFARALQENKLVGAASVEELTTRKVPMGPDAGYAYGFGDHSINGRRYFGHNGGAPGINAEFSVFPDLGMTVIVLSNYEHGATPVAEKARELIAYN